MKILGNFFGVKNSLHSFFVHRSVAVIIVVCIEMGKDTLTDWRTILIALLGILAVFMFKKLNPAFLVIGGSIFGAILIQF